MKMERVMLCAECGKLLDREALVNLVVSYEEDEEADEIFEQGWHKKCYFEYLKRIYEEVAQ